LESLNFLFSFFKLLLHEVTSELSLFKFLFGFIQQSFGLSDQGFLLLDFSFFFLKQALLLLKGFQVHSSYFLEVFLLELC